MTTTTQIEEKDKEDCFGHEYEHQDVLPVGPDTYDELLVCIHCGHEKTITHYIGVRD